MSSPLTLEDEVRVLGLSLIGKAPKRGKSIKEQNRTFRAHYGAGWAVVAFLWQALLDIEKAKNRTAENETKMKKEKLFWCLYFIKVYPTEDVSASKMDCDQGIFRKWVWIYVRDIAFLAPFYVSFLFKKGSSPAFFLLLTPFLLFSDQT